MKRKKVERMENLSIRLSKDQRKEINKIAKKNDANASDVVRYAVDKLIEAQGKPPCKHCCVEQSAEQSQ